MDNLTVWCNLPMFGLDALVILRGKVKRDVKLMDGMPPALINGSELNSTSEQWSEFVLGHLAERIK